MTEQLDLFVASSHQEIISDKLPQISHLTPRQWNLYRLIKHNSLVEHRKTTQREIFDKVVGYEWNDDPKAHDHCSAIWSDITENNLSQEHEHLIISKNFEYWLGSEEEAKQFLNDLWKALEPRLSRYWNYYKKLKQNGQGKLLDKNNNPIDNESVANRFFEAFNDYNITKKRLENEIKD